MNILERKNSPRFKKYIIVTAILILALLSIFVFFYISDWGKQEFAFDGEVFQLTQCSLRKMTLRDTEGNALVFTREATITRIAQYKGEVVRFGGGYGGLTGLGYTFSDGTRAEAYTSSDFTHFQQREVQLMKALEDYFRSISIKYKHPFYYAILLIMVIAIVITAMYMVFYPEESWENNTLRRLFIRGGEPTDFALFAYQVGGGSLIAISVLIFLSLIIR